MEFVTDRTEEDVLLGNERGHYGNKDLNRVEKAVAELCELAEKLDIHPGLVTQTDWRSPGVFSIDSWPSESQMRRYLQNVNSLCDQFAVKGTLPVTMDQLDYKGANGIEQALEQVYNKINIVLSAFRYSGDYYAGEEHGL